MNIGDRFNLKTTTFYAVTIGSRETGKYKTCNVEVVDVYAGEHGCFNKKSYALLNPKNVLVEIVGETTIGDNEYWKVKLLLNKTQPAIEFVRSPYKRKDGTYNPNINTFLYDRGIGTTLNSQHGIADNTALIKK